MDLTTRLGSLTLRNPLMSASGTFGHGMEMRHFVPPGRLGAWVSKTVTPRPRHGNPAPRIQETEAGFLNSIGLENKGVGSYASEVVPTLHGLDTVIITNIGGERPEAFAEAAAELDRHEEIDAFEVNLSCPNVDGGKLPFSTDPPVAEAIIRGVREVTRKPILAKLSPNVTRIGEMAVAVEAGGADGITAVNTLLGLAVDWRTGRPALNTGPGGYSGISIKPVALRCAWECARAVSIPVVGCGGVARAEDVLEYLAVGCRAVQVGTASFSDPGLLGRLPEEVAACLTGAGFEQLEDVVGIMGRAPALS